VQSQRAAKAGNLRNRQPLSKSRVDLLDSINFKWIGAVVGDEETWDERFEEFSNFVQNGHLSLPSLINGVRNPLYSWWMNQKISFKKNALQEEKVQAFKSIGLSLEMDEKQIERTWEENFDEIKNNIDSTGILNIPHILNGNLNPMYSWYRNQKTAFQKGSMPAERISKFQSIGVSFENFQFENRGFNVWASNFRKIAKFINENERYPKASSNPEELKLYQSFAKTKRAFKNGSLSEKQITLINELKIEIE
jgi:hypothetical protein